LRLVRIGVSAVPLTPASSGGGRGCRAARHVSASGSAALVAAARTGALVRERQPEEQRLQIGGEVTRRAQVLAQDVTDAADGFALNWHWRLPSHRRQTPFVVDKGTHRGRHRSTASEISIAESIS